MTNSVRERIRGMRRVMLIKEEITEAPVGMKLVVVAEINGEIFRRFAYYSGHISSAVDSIVRELEEISKGGNNEYTTISGTRLPKREREKRSRCGSDERNHQSLSRIAL